MPHIPSIWTIPGGPWTPLWIDGRKYFSQYGPWDLNKKSKDELKGPKVLWIQLMNDVGFQLVLTLNFYGMTLHIVYRLFIEIASVFSMILLCLESFTEVKNWFLKCQIFLYLSLVNCWKNKNKLWIVAAIIAIPNLFKLHILSCDLIWFM